MWLGSDTASEGHQQQEAAGLSTTKTREGPIASPQGLLKATWERTCSKRLAQASHLVPQGPGDALEHASAERAILPPAGLDRFAPLQILIELRV